MFLNDTLFLPSLNNIVINNCEKIVQKIESNNANDFYFNQGTTATIYKLKDVILKYFQEETEEDKWIDIEVLSNLQDLKTYPSLFGYHKEKKFMLVEYIDGNFLYELDNDYKIPKEAWINLFHDIAETFLRGYMPYDLHDENIIYNKEEEKFYIIDVGEFVQRKEHHQKINSLIIFDYYEFKNNREYNIFQLYKEVMAKYKICA